MRLAFIGTSHVHTPDYLAVSRAMASVEVVGIARPDHDTITLLSDLPPLFERQEELPDHDVAVILTDAESHNQVCTKLTAPAVFIEKPLAVSLKSAKLISGLLQQQQIETEVGFFLRHSDALKTLCKACDRSEMGSIRFARLSFAHSGLLDGWLQKWPAHTSATRMGGGAFVDLAIHLVDAASFVLGPLEAVSCQLDAGSSKRLDLDPSFDTQGQATFTSHEGALVHIWASAEAPRTELAIEVFCERGEITLQAGRVTRKHRSNAPEVLFDRAMPTPADGFRAALEGFRSKNSRIVHIEEAVSASALIESMLSVRPVLGKKKGPLGQT